MQFIVDNNLGDLASLLALLITVVGFFFILKNVLKSKKAAQAAADAAQQVIRNLARTDTVAECSSAISTMDEIKRLHRQGTWSILPDRYAALIKSLITIKTANPDVTDQYKRQIQSAIQILTGLERTIERSLSTNHPPSDVPKLTTLVSAQTQKLQQVLSSIRNEIGREYHE